MLQNVLSVLLALSVISGTVSGNHVGCEENLVAFEEQQTVSTPDFPDNYENDLQCTWVIFASSPGSQVEVEFDRVLTEACCDYVQVRDGFRSDSPVVANFRGNFSGCSYVSTFGALYITFVSDETITDVGFQFHYSIASYEGGCSMDNLTALPGEPDSTDQAIMSPGWPVSYPSNTICTWIITAVEGYQVVLRLSVTQLANPCDSVLVRDGVDEAAPLLANVRRSLSGRPLVASTGGVLHVRFRSDRVMESSGILLYYYAARPEDITRIEPVPGIRECGGELETPDSGHGSFTSPGFPLPHAGDLECAWIISAPEGERVRVYFNYINTERCCDWIKVRDGPDFDSTKLGVLSGYHPRFNSFVSSGNVLRVEFDTDDSLNGRGFTGIYETYREGADEVESACGGSYTATDGLQYISTPNWPDEYSGSLNCTWVIRTEGMETRVRFHILGAHTEAFFDLLRVYNGETATGANRIITLTGSHFQQYIVTSSGSALTIEFLSDASIHSGGFRASYQQVLPTTDEDPRR